jgi:hypothetical protein
LDRQRAKILHEIQRRVSPFSRIEQPIREIAVVRRSKRSSTSGDDQGDEEQRNAGGCPVLGKDDTVWSPFRAKNKIKGTLILGSERNVKELVDSSKRNERTQKNDNENN